MSEGQMRIWQAIRYEVASLALREVPIPQIGVNQILVKVGAVSLNYRDKLVLEGGFGTSFPLPPVPASDAAGTVTAIGDQVRRFKVGDRVISHFYPRWLRGEIRAEEESENLGVPLPGVLAEYIVLDEHGTVHTPPHLSDAEASTLPIAAVTAWSALFEKCRIQPGDTVLIQGTGGVSLFGLQLAVAAGAKVIVTSSNDDKLRRAKELGAYAGINYVQQPEWQKSVQSLTGGDGVSHVLEVSGGENIRRSAEALARGGHIAIVGFLQDDSFQLKILPLMLKLGTIHTVGVGSRESFERVNRALEASQIHPVIDSQFPFTEVPLAFARLLRGPFGKVVVRFDDQKENSSLHSTKTA
jgi:NADPH:quinone reductase-like Zn-dependent oxidoreductase